MDVLRYIAMDQAGGGAPSAAAAAAVLKVGCWDTVLEFGSYQHVTVDGKPVVQLFDASRAQATLDDFEQHPESDIFYDRFHEVTDEVPSEEGEPLSAYRARLQAWAKGVESDGKALAWAHALCTVVGSQIARYVPHPGAPEQPPVYEKLCADQGRRVPDGVYCLRSEITPRGADPKEGLAVTRYTSPYFVSQRDGDRLLCLTGTNDPRMRGAALARFEREAPVRFVAMTRMTAPGPQEMSMPFDKEMMARCGMEESDSEAAKVEKVAKYIRKMDEEAAAAKKDKEEAMGRVAKMEEEGKEVAAARKKMEDDVAEMKRKFESGENPFKKKDDEDKGDKEKMTAMQRTVASLQEKLTVVTDTLKRTQENQDADRKVAMERQQQETERAAVAWADDALARGRWDAMHAGGNKDEKDPERRITMTRVHLAKKYKTDPAQAESDLFDPGTFQPDERLAMSRITENGAGRGQPDPREGVTVDARMDAAIAREISEAQKAGKEIDAHIAMSRVKAKQPSLYTEYHRAAGGRTN